MGDVVVVDAEELADAAKTLSAMADEASDVAGRLAGLAMPEMPPAMAHRVADEVSDIRRALLGDASAVGPVPPELRRRAEAARRADGGNQALGLGLGIVGAQVETFAAAGRQGHLFLRNPAVRGVAGAASLAGGLVIPAALQWYGDRGNPYLSGAQKRDRVAHAAIKGVGTVAATAALTAGAVALGATAPVSIPIGLAVGAAATVFDDQLDDAIDGAESLAQGVAHAVEDSVVDVGKGLASGVLHGFGI